MIPRASIGARRVLEYTAIAKYTSSFVWIIAMQTWLCLLPLAAAHVASAATREGRGPLVVNVHPAGCTGSAGRSDANGDCHGVLAAAVARCRAHG